MVLNNRVNQLLKNKSIAADIPARLETQTRVGLSHAAHGMGIGLAECGVRDEGPMLFLTAFGRIHVLAARKKILRFAASSTPCRRRS